jgi:hypothetical protein
VEALESHRAPRPPAVLGSSKPPPFLHLLFVSNAECDSIYVAHSLSVIPGDVTDVTVVDDLVLGIVGDNPTAAFPVVFPQASFTGRVAVQAEYCSTLVTHHGAAPPIFRTGPHAAVVPGTSVIAARPIMVMPAEMSALALSSLPRTGRYTLLGFFDLFTHPSYTGTPAQRAFIRPLANWWRLSCTDTVVGGPTETSIALVGTATPLLQAKVASHANHIIGGQMSRIGVGGPGLTTTAFALGITELKNTLEGNHAATLSFEQAKNEKTFMDMHGNALAATLHCLCGVTPRPLRGASIV